MNWIDIKDREPEDSGNVLVSVKLPVWAGAYGSHGTFVTVIVTSFVTPFTLSVRTASP